MKLRWFWIVTLAGFAAQLSAQEPKKETPPPAARGANGRSQDQMRKFFGLGAAPDPEAVARGQAVFAAKCGFCHGTNANGGNSGPDLVRSVLVLHDEGSGKEIAPVILHGRPGTAMPAFALTDDQIHDIAQFLLMRSQSTANRMEYKILNVVTGNAEAGKAYFDAHCSSCHSPNGDLAHIATKFDAVALQSRFLYPMEHRYPGQPGPPPDPRSVTTVTVTTPDGKTVSGQLMFIDDFSAFVKPADGPPQPVDISAETGARVEIHDPLKGHEELLTQYTDQDMHNVLAYLETLK